MPLSSFLQHELSSENAGSLLQLKQNAGECTRINDVLDSFVKKHVSQEQQASIFGAVGDVYFDAARAQELGIVTGIGYPVIRVDAQLELAF